MITHILSVHWLLCNPCLPPPHMPAHKKTTNASPFEDGPLLQVPLGSISLNPSQPRKHFTPQALQNLADSLRAQGIIQPLAVRPHPHRNPGWELIAGERRLRAMRLLGWQKAPVVVRKVDDAQLVELALVENVQREALTPLEEAHAYRSLQQRFGYTQQALAKKIGKERSTIANTLRLLALPHALQADLNAQRLSMGHARALLALPQIEQQLALGKYVVVHGISVRQTEQWVRKILQGTKPPVAVQHTNPKANVQASTPQPPFSTQQAMLRHARQRLENHMNTRVDIEWPQKQGGMGSIQIAFHGREEFNHLFEKLLKT